MAFFKTTHLATLAETYLKTFLDYKISGSQRGLLRETTKAMLGVNGNAYDVAVAFMISQLNVMTGEGDERHTKRVTEFVANKIPILEKMNQSAVGDWTADIDKTRDKFLGLADLKASQSEETKTTPTQLKQEVELTKSDLFHETKVENEKKETKKLEVAQVKEIDTPLDSNDAEEVNIETNQIDISALIDTTYDHLHEHAYLELENNQKHIGTWAKVLVAANGDEKQAKLLYLKVRPEVLKQEEALLEDQIEESKRLEAERLEAERLEAERLEAERQEAERQEAKRLEAERLEAKKLERQERLKAEEEKKLQIFRDKAQKFFTSRDTSDFQKSESEVASSAPKLNAMINFSDETQRQFKAKAFQIYYASFPKELLAVPSNFNPYFSNFSDKYRNKIPIDSSINSIDFHLLFLGFFSGILDLSRLDDWIKSNDDRVNFIAHALDGKHETGYWENINFPSYCRWLDRQLLKKPHHPDIVLRRLYALDWLLGNKNQAN